MSGEQVVDSLVSGKRLDEKRAAEARVASKREGVPIGRWLMEAGWIAPDAWSEEAARVVGAPFVAEPLRDEAVVRRWPLEFFERHRSAPLRMEEGRLLVAVLDPTDRENLEAIEAFVRMPVRPVCTAERALSNGASRRSPAESDTPTLPLDEPQTETHLRLLHEILRSAIRRAATDVHLVSTPGGLDVRLRIDGLLGATTWTADPSTAGPLVNRLRVLSGADLTETRIPQDGSFALRTVTGRVDVRASFLPIEGGTSVVLRLLDRERFSSESLTLGGLGLLPPERERLLGALRKPHGLILVVGPTGSGKSTTLHAALSEAADPTRKLVTIEDPIEYRLRSAVQVEVNERAGLTFASGLRSVLRHDPDCILVGEIRDAETAGIALQAALTGHLVLTTLHATQAADVGARMDALQVDAGSFARALSILVAQRLVRRTCPSCRTKGCSTCEGSGYRGRLAIAEVHAIEGSALRPVRSVADVVAAQISAGTTTRSEIERVWPEALQ